MIEIGLLGLLFVLKLLATSLTLGSGASGGIFSPALFMGATMGGAYGALLAQVFPQLQASPPAFALAGMAGIVGGSTGAAMAAIVMIFEMTLDYNVIVPMTITVALSYGIRKMVCADSIYTLKLARRGHYMPEALQANFHQLRRAGELMETNLASVPVASPLTEFARAASAPTAAPWYLVRNGDGVVGLASREMAIQAFAAPAVGATIGDIALRRYVTVTEQATVAAVAARLHQSHSSVALVTRNGGRASIEDVKGVITRRELGTAVSDAVDLFGDS